MHPYTLIFIFTRFALIVMIASGCRKFPVESGCDVSSEVERRIGMQVEWNRKEGACDRVRSFINALMDQELTVDSAVQIALLNNPRISAMFEEIGIAHADLIEAGLLSNPIFDLALRVPDKSGFRVNTEYSIVQNFIDLFMIPLRMRVSAAKLERVKLDVSKRIIDLAFDVEETYDHFSALLNKKKLVEDIVDISEISFLIAEKQRESGNINRLELQRRFALYQDKTLELVEVEAKIIQVRERFNVLLGLNVCDTGLRMNSKILEVDDDEPSLSVLEQIACRERLDIRSACMHLDSIIKSFPKTAWWTFTGLQFGVSSAREPDPASPWTTGPVVSGQIPVFNYGQASRKRLIAQYRQACAELQALYVKVFAEVREANDKVMTYRKLVNSYVENILPTHDLIFESTEQLYHSMGAGIYELLDSKMNLLTSQINYETALLNYRTSKVMLKRAVGGSISNEIYSVEGI